jgi:hypothetical protein
LDFFSYHWKNDRNLAVREDDDVDLLDQLPIDV